MGYLRVQHTLDVHSILLKSRRKAVDNFFYWRLDMPEIRYCLNYSSVYLKYGTQAHTRRNQFPPNLIPTTQQK